jgi:hypothetical protein
LPAKRRLAVEQAENWKAGKGTLENDLLVLLQGKLDNTILNQYVFVIHKVQPIEFM